MSRKELSRRKVLAGLATAGAAGGFVGGGAAAVFSDTETFTNNSIQASATVSGELHLDVETDFITKELDLSDHFDFEKDHFGNDEKFGNDGKFDKFEKRIPKWTVTLPEEETNNPAFIWLRLKACPEPLKFARFIWVKVKVHGEHHSETLVHGNLLEVAAELRKGVALDPDVGSDDPGSQDCFEPGESVEVVLEWGILGHFRGKSRTISMPFEFRAKQCRYNDGTVNPFHPDGIDPDLLDCEPDRDDKRQAISYLAFCTDEDGPLEAPTIEVLASDEDGPTEVEWTSETPIDHVVLKAGQLCKRYSYPGGETNATVNSGLEDIFPNPYVDRVECNPPNPCTVTDADGASIKLEEEGGTWVLEEEEEEE